MVIKFYEKALAVFRDEADGGVGKAEEVDVYDDYNGASYQLGPGSLVTFTSFRTESLVAIGLNNCNFMRLYVFVCICWVEIVSSIYRNIWRSIQLSYLSHAVRTLWQFQYFFCVGWKHTECITNRNKKINVKMPSFPFQSYDSPYKRVVFKGATSNPTIWLLLNRDGVNARKMARMRLQPLLFYFSLST